MSRYPGEKGNMAILRVRKDVTLLRDKRGPCYTLST